jgi:transposase-like protein
MGMARYVVDAVLLEGRSAREVARAHGISKTCVYELISRYRAGGYEALEPQSKRPRSCKHETSAALVEAIVELRHELQSQGHDAGAETIAYHLAQDHETRRSGGFSGVRGWSWPSDRSDPSARSCALKRSCPTSAGRPTSPPGSWAAARRSRSST